jgi:Cu2+-exporting ATPase
MTSCCTFDAELAAKRSNGRRDAAMHEEMLLASRQVGNQLRQTDLSVPDIHCGACIHRIETALGGLAGVEAARVNLSTKRVAIRWRADGPPPPLLETLKALGYNAHIFDGGAEEDATLSGLIRALAVAGFAAGNIMLFSVSVWSGAEPPTRDLFHWLSALIALPALAYSGRVFFRSAWASVSHGQTNMDVPISIGVLLAFGMSLYDTAHHVEHAYFDASISLLFFLLIGRTLDHMMRERARVAVNGLARLTPRGAMIVHEDGGCAYLPVSEIEPGMTIRLAAGEHVPVDATVLGGRSDLDCSLASGESVPIPVEQGSVLQAGTLNLTGPLTIRATAAAKDSFLAEMVRLMESAEGGRSRYRRIADRAARLYAPAVHLTALLSFIGWMIETGGDVHRAITIAVAVLIITCPCALGLAVPMVQVVAARRLFASGIMMKDGSALERLAEIDSVVFDKTGTLTLGQPRLADDRVVDPAHFRLAAAIAAHSRHPYSRALAAAGAAGGPQVALDSVSEHPGVGLEAVSGATVYRLGRAVWALDEVGRREVVADDASAVLSRDGRLVAEFRFDDRIRPGARAAIAALTRVGLTVGIISGDRSLPVRLLASALGVRQFEAGVLPGEKAARIAALAAAGHTVLMVGDGLNDAPALVAAHVSMAPATAADLGRNVADFVFMRESLEAVRLAIAIARDARRLIRQNFFLAVVYNVFAVPVAILGHVTPLVAALAMSLSSIIVVGNALRLKGGSPEEQSSPGETEATAAARTPPIMT